MSVHFFYNYKDELIKQLKERYSTELIQKKERERLTAQLDEAEKVIKDYFQANINDLKEIIDVSSGKVDYFFEEPLHIKLEIDQNFIEFKRLDMSIEIRLGLYDPQADIVGAEVECYIIPGEKRCKIKKVGRIHDGSNFDENTINHYVRKAFSDLLSHL